MIRDLLHLVAIVALILAIIGLTEINNSRRGSARDSCQLIRGLVLSSVAKAPAAQRDNVDRYIAGTPLHNCGVYARTIVH